MVATQDSFLTLESILRVFNDYCHWFLGGTLVRQSATQAYGSVHIQIHCPGSIQWVHMYDSVRGSCVSMQFRAWVQGKLNGQLDSILPVAQLLAAALVISVVWHCLTRSVQLQPNKTRDKYKHKSVQQPLSRLSPLLWILSLQFGKATYKHWPDLTFVVSCQCLSRL